MADVFLSYAREDAARAEQIAVGLIAAGLEVFWDNEIPPGQTWADYIEAKLTQCKALIVLWSEHSVKSQWVREEARLGRDKGVLIPAMVDNVSPPFGFGEVQAANLSGWNGSPEDANWRRFVDAVSRATQGAAAPRPFTAPPPVAPPPPRPSAPQPVAAAQSDKKSVPVWVWVVAALVGTIVVLGIIGSMMPQQQVAGPPQNPAAAAQTSQAGQNGYEQQILQRLAQVQQSLAAQGFQQIAQPVTGQLNTGQSQNWPLTMNTGIDYRIIGVCDNDCGNMDLVIYDENNTAVAQDVLPDATPIATVAPRWNGSFTAQAHMQHCTVQPCYYALVLYGRPLQ